MENWKIDKETELLKEKDTTEIAERLYDLAKDMDFADYEEE